MKKCQTCQCCMQPAVIYSHGLLLQMLSGSPLLSLAPIFHTSKYGLGGCDLPNKRVNWGPSWSQSQAGIRETQVMNWVYIKGKLWDWTTLQTWVPPLVKPLIYSKQCCLILHWRDSLPRQHSPCWGKVAGKDWKRNPCSKPDSMGIHHLVPQAPQHWSTHRNGVFTWATAEQLHSKGMTFS